MLIRSDSSEYTATLPFKLQHVTRLSDQTHDWSSERASRLYYVTTTKPKSSLLYLILPHGDLDTPPAPCHVRNMLRESLGLLKVYSDSCLQKTWVTTMPIRHRWHLTTYFLSRCGVSCCWLHCSDRDTRLYVSDAIPPATDGLDDTTSIPPSPGQPALRA